MCELAAPQTSKSKFPKTKHFHTWSQVFLLTQNFRTQSWKNRDEDFTCVLACLTRFLSKQVAQNLSRQNPASARHTTCEHNSLRLNPNLRTRRIAQHTSENNGAQTALWPCSIMCAPSCIQAVAQSLCRQNRTTSVRRILSDGLSPYTTICVHSLLPKQAAENFCRLICATLMNRQLPNNFPPRSLCLHPPTTAGGAEFLKTDLRDRCKDCWQTIFPHVLLSPPSFPKQVAQNF